MMRSLSTMAGVLAAAASTLMLLPAPATATAATRPAGSTTAVDAVVSVPSAVVLDSATGVGTGRGPVSARTRLSVPVLGRAGVPGAGVEAVRLAVTVTRPTAAGSLSVYPAGGNPPSPASSIFAAGSMTTASVLVPVLPGGRAMFTNDSGGTIGLRAVVTGYVRAGSAGRPSGVTGSGQRLHNGGLDIAFTMPAGAGARTSAIYTLHDRTDPSRPDLVVSHPIYAVAGTRVAEVITSNEGVLPHLYSVAVALRDETGPGLASAPVELPGAPCGDLDSYSSVVDLHSSVRGVIVTLKFTINPQGGSLTRVRIVHGRGRIDNYVVRGLRPATVTVVDNVGYNPDGTNIDLLRVDVDNECGQVEDQYEFPTFARPTLTVTPLAGNRISLVADTLTPNSWIGFNCHVGSDSAHRYPDATPVVATFYAHADADGVATAVPPRTCRFPAATATAPYGWVSLAGNEPYDRNFKSNEIALS